MSGSHHTEPPNVYARWHAKRGRKGKVLVPRILHRAPKLGDLHPLNRNIIRNYLMDVPWSYINGLRGIECRPRKGVAVGDPFGLYSPVEKRIWLYSVPLGDWDFLHGASSSNEGWQRYYRRLDATVSNTETGIRVSWSRPVDVELLFVNVLFHELGHHYTHAFKRRRKLPKDLNASEGLANMHVGRLWKHVLRVRGVDT